jgi:HAD superfamily hydrolase (TIGR01490 family)
MGLLREFEGHRRLGFLTASRWTSPKFWPHAGTPFRDALFLWYGACQRRQRAAKRVRRSRVGLVFFDMDRTLVRKNTAQLLVRYQREIGEATWWDTLRVGFWVVQYTFGFVNAEKVAQFALRPLIGAREDVLVERCKHWFWRDVAQHVGERAKDTVADHIAKGDVCAIVTASMGFAASPLAQALRIPHVIATELEVDDEGRFTGKFIGPICYGIGKIDRSEQLARAHGTTLKESTFYSDSISDLPMLEAVGTPIAVNPDPRLARIARARGWRIEAW